MDCVYWKADKRSHRPTDLDFGVGDLLAERLEVRGVVVVAG